MPPFNSLTVDRPVDSLRFFAIESGPAPPEVIFGDDFESGQGDWTVGSEGAAGTAWELGTPMIVGPPAAHSGENCFGTNLDDTYDNDADVWLRSPPIDLTAAGSATLNYFHYLSTEAGFDFGTLSILNAADNSVLAVIDGAIADVLKLEKLEFRLQSDEILGFDGWHVDDVLVTVP